MNLPDSAVASIQDGRPGQCVIFISKAAFKTVRYNKWFDNLRIVFVPDRVAPDTVTAISVQRKEPLREHPPTNVFMTRMTFQALEGFQSAQAFAILTDSDNPTGLPGQRVAWSNSEHSVFFQGTDSTSPSLPLIEIVQQYTILLVPWATQICFGSRRWLDLQTASS